MKFIESADCYDVIFRAIQKYGKKVQLDMVIEECAELIVSINKFRRNGLKEKDNLITEIADVLIMVEQLKIICEIGEIELNSEIEKKINRLELRLLKP